MRKQPIKQVKLIPIALLFLLTAIYGSAPTYTMTDRNGPTDQRASGLPDVTFTGPEEAKRQPISSILNEDGSIKRGVSGSFDPHGFRMMPDQDGVPRFVVDDGRDSSELSPLSDCGDDWDDRFYTNGTNAFNNPVDAIASDDSGNLYIGGFFFLCRKLTCK